MSHKDIKAISETYRSMYAEPEIAEEEQLDEAAKSPKQISRRADTLSKNVGELRSMIDQALRGMDGVSSKDARKVVEAIRDAEINLVDAIDAAERLMK